MQERRFEKARFAAQIERDLLRQRLGREACPALPTGEIGGQRHLRHAFVDPADLVADDEPRLDQPEGGLVAVAERRERRVAHLDEPGHRMAAQPGERDREPHRLDHRRRARRLALGAQQACDLGEPGGGELGRRRPAAGPVVQCPEMPVPAGRRDARAVAARRREAGLGPGNPARRGLELRPSAQQGAVGRGALVGAQRRHMPGAGHDGDGAVDLLQRLADLEAHMRLAAILVLGAEHCGRAVLRPGAAELGHRRLDRREHVGAAARALDERVPEGLPVGMARDQRDRLERIAARLRGGGLVRSRLGRRVRAPRAPCAPRATAPPASR